MNTPRNPWLNMLSNPKTGEDLNFGKAMQGFANGLLQRVNDQVPQFAGSKPTFDFMPPHAVSGLIAMQANGVPSPAPAGPTGTVTIDAAHLAQLLYGRDPGHAFMEGALPHELAHLHQTPAVWGDTQQLEGGAEAFRNANAARIFAKADPSYSDAAYPGSGWSPLAHAITASKTPAWINYGQFGAATP